MLAPSIEESLILTLLDVDNYLTKHSEAIALEGGLTVQQWLVLLQIADSERFPRPPKTARGNANAVLASHIAEERGVSRPNISALVSALLRKGLVEQSEDPADRRRKALRISARGLRALERLEPVRQRVNNELFDDFSEAEKAALLGLLQRWLEKLWHLDEGTRAGNQIASRQSG